MGDEWDESIEYVKPEGALPDNYYGEVKPQERNYRSRNNGDSSYNRRSNNYQNGYQRGNRNDNATLIKIPTRFVGKVIGRGGSTINELQSETNTRIIVTKENDGDETTVKIIGSPDDVQRAQDRINEIATEPKPIVKENLEPEPEVGSERPKINWQEAFAQCVEEEKEYWSKIPMKKEFYTEHPEVTRMSDEEVETFRAENMNIVVDRTFHKEDSKPIPKPCLTFEHAFHEYPEILEEIKKAGFQKPSPIQSQSWPVLLSGEDLIGIAQTGTGKTLAFLLPALIHIDGQPIPKEEREGPSVLVMAPTRELALQIKQEVDKYQYKGINAVCIYGGGSRKDQIKIVTDGVDIIIATPGRLNDLITNGYLKVKNITYCVLDEADRMLDMGFEPQIRKVMYMVRPDRQTVMTSATWPLGVRRLADSYMADPVQVYVGTLDLAATHTVTQTIELLNEDDKMNTLMQFFHNMTADDKVIVFCGKKSRADHLSSELACIGIDCQTLHGDRDQCDREQALADIKSGTVQILIATDVASRGLDIDDITHVINFDFPRNIEEYVHRVGRTGRAGKSGHSISFFTREDWAQAKELINILEEAQQYIPEEIYKMSERYGVWKEKKDKEKQFCNSGQGGFRNRSRW